MHEALKPMAGAPHGEMQAGENGGGDTLLTCVPSRRRSRTIPNIGLEVGVEIRDLRQGAGSQSRITVHSRLIESGFCELASQRCLESTIRLL